MVFHTRRPLGHVGIYIGNSQFVHASYQKQNYHAQIAWILPTFKKDFSAPYA